MHKHTMINNKMPSEYTRWLY